MTEQKERKEVFTTTVDGIEVNRVYTPADLKGGTFTKENLNIVCPAGQQARVQCYVADPFNANSWYKGTLIFYVNDQEIPDVLGNQWVYVAADEKSLPPY